MSFRLADAIFWIAVVCCAIAQLAILRSAFISPARVADPATTTTAARRVGEIAWALLPGIALIFLFVFTWRAMHKSAVVAGIVASALQ